MDYKNADMYALMCERDKCAAELAKYAKSGLSLDLSRGKPSAEQLALSLNMLDVLDHRSILDSESGQDCRNYGGLDGIEEAKRLLSHMMGTHSVNTIVGGNSSLTMMYELVSHGMTDGICGAKPWQEIKNRKFLCPAPGYDRHFAITEHFGFELIPVGMTESGPDMDEVEDLIKDETVKGIWCVPKYSNPEGITYSDNVVRRMAHMKPAAGDFRIFWDNAYAVHDLYDEGDTLLNIYNECVKAGSPDLPIIFTSTSKITFPGAGVAVEAASPNNVALLKGRMKYQTIGPDKLNQLRHARMFRTVSDIERHMKRHAAILRPKFETVEKELQKQLGDTGVARWTTPKGGYFISLYVLEGCAKRVEQLCANAGMILTPAGATYPYGIDPKDSNIRIAPSYPSVEEIEKASEVLALAVRYAALEKLLSDKEN